MSGKAFVEGIGGVFFKCADVAGTRKWYGEMLGIAIDPRYGGSEFLWRGHDDPARVGRTVWAPFAGDTDYFGPSDSPFMINYRVRDLDGLLEHLAARGVERVGDIVEESYGRFAWIVDPDGRRVELWEPKEED